jgi:hypothetical protein
MCGSGGCRCFLLGTDSSQVRNADLAHLDVRIFDKEAELPPERIVWARVVHSMP